MWTREPFALWSVTALGLGAQRMSEGAIYKAGWTLDDVDWAAFDASKVDHDLLCAVKAAALVELNAPDYVVYLKRVYDDTRPDAIPAIEHWGTEEVQHGLALGRWAEMADPTFKLDAAFQRFRAGYRPAHFTAGDGSVRGSRRGEMIARCVVESGTSSYYSAMRDATAEPVLREVAGRIAADEFRHYQLFYKILTTETEPELPLWRKIYVAVTRVNEAEDDELSYAYYAANVPADKTAEIPYVRKTYARAYHSKAMVLYRRHHIDKLVKMVAKPAGLNPSGRISALASAALWRVLSHRAGAPTAPVSPRTA
ncbi:MAG: hypothetical protein RJB62_1941 [Pseudomonadota bacterium]